MPTSPIFRIYSLKNDTVFIASVYNFLKENLIYLPYDLDQFTSYVLSLEEHNDILVYASKDEILFVISFSCNVCSLLSLGLDAGAIVTDLIYNRKEIYETYIWIAFFEELKSIAMANRLTQIRFYIELSRELKFFIDNLMLKYEYIKLYPSSNKLILKCSN